MVTVMERTHGVTHWDPDACFGCKVQTTQFSASVFETTPGGAKAASMGRRERQMVRDLDAFKRMRLAGEQPPSTVGAARLESEAESTYEIVSGQPAHKMAKGSDAAKPVSKRGKEWRRRANEAHTAIQRGEVVSA